VNANPVVLIVEDNFFVRKALGRLLEREGIPSVDAAGLEEAREHLVGHGATLRAVVIDIDLGDENGLDLVHELRQGGRRPKILVFSASLDNASRAGAIGLVADEVLVKPASPKAILAAVQRQLDAAGSGTTGEWLRTHPSCGIRTS
jgi:DNA-binding response OmpR family regulator